MTRTFAILALLLLAGTAQAADLPNPDITPGKVLTTDTAKICKPGYPKTVRPPASYTNRLKAKQLGMALHDKRLKLYEEDHLVSLELGGDPRDPLNLWPEAYSGTWGAKVKDRVENYLHAEVCAGRLPLATAQQEIATNWIEAYRRYLGEP